MDGLTQAALGAVVGQAVGARRLGQRRAAWWGALGGFLPDLDFVAGLAGPWATMVHHRGVSHALWFGPVVGTALGYAVWRGYRRRAERRGDPDIDDGPAPHPGGRAQLGAWIALFVLAIFTHPLLDVFTTYGTQLLAPFSDRRFSLHGVGVIDPAYTLVLIAALAYGARRRGRPNRSRVAAIVALVLTTAYLGAGYRINQQAETIARAMLASKGVQVRELHCYPTVFQLSLRRVVARSNDGVWHIGWLSMWRPQPIRWRTYRPPIDPLAARLARSPKGRLFDWFAGGVVTASVASKGDEHVVELHDIRYGLFDGAPYQGIWGIRGRFDRAGALRSIIRFRDRSRDMGANFAHLLRAAFAMPGTEGGWR